MLEPHSEHHRSRWLAAALLLTLAVGVRVLAIAWLGGLSTPPVPGSDADEYDTYAWNLVQGRGYRGPSVDVTDPDHLTAYRPPVPSLWYAAIYTVFGHSYVAAQLGNALLGGLTALWLIRLGGFCFDRRTGWLAGVAFAVFPFGWIYSVGILSEPIAALLVVAVVDAAARIRTDRGFRWALGAGVAFGLLLLTKPGFIFTFPFAALWALYVCGRDRRLWARAITLGVTTGLVIVPWAVRNLLVLGAFIPFGTGGGQLLLCTSNRWVVSDPGLYGYSVMDNALPEYRAALAAPNNEIARDALAKKLGAEWLRANPDKWFYLARTRLWRQWAPRLHRPQPTTAQRLFEADLLLYFAAFLAGLPWATAQLLHRRHPGLMMHVMLLGNTAMAVAFHGQHRYRFPTESLAILIGAAGLIAGLDAVRRSGARELARQAAAGLRRHRVVLAVGALALAAVAAACLRDDARIERYRRERCEATLDRIVAACRSFEHREQRSPGSIGELIPEDLPNLDAAHCPKHSISWHAYQLLAESTARGHEEFLSYRLEPGGAGAGTLRVVETEARHGGLPLERVLKP